MMTLRERFIAVLERRPLTGRALSILGINTKLMGKIGNDYFGAVVSEFSTKSRDEADIFTDPAIQRAPEVVG